MIQMVRYGGDFSLPPLVDCQQNKSFPKWQMCRRVGRVSAGSDGIPTNGDPPVQSEQGHMLDMEISLAYVHHRKLLDTGNLCFYF